MYASMSLKSLASPHSAFLARRYEGPSVAGNFATEASSHHVVTSPHFHTSKMWKSVSLWGECVGCGEVCWGVGEVRNDAGRGVGECTG